VRLLHVAVLSGLSSSWLALQGVSAWEHGSTSCHDTPSLNMEGRDTCRPPWLGTTRRLVWKLHCPRSCHPCGGITSGLALIGPYWDNWPQLANKQGLLRSVESQSNTYTHTTQKLSMYRNETPQPEIWYSMHTLSLSSPGSTWHTSPLQCLGARDSGWCTHLSSQYVYKRFHIVAISLPRGGSTKYWWWHYDHNMSA